MSAFLESVSFVLRIVILSLVDFRSYDELFSFSNSFSWVTGAEDDFTGFESGTGAKEKQHDDENARTFPRISRTYSKKRFVTSGDGEDQGGSKDDKRSDSKSHNSKDQGSANEDFFSNMDLAKSEYIAKRSSPLVANA